MYIEISTSIHPATDLGFLLHKNPARAHVAELPFGRAHMVYTEAGPERCTFALVLDVDPVALVRGSAKSDGKGGGKPNSGALEAYVNDRPYAASSFLSVAIAQGLRSALNGHCKERPELAARKIPLEAMVTPLPARGRPGFVQELFEPLGYEVTVTPIPLDPHWPDWGDSAYVTLRLAADVRLADLLSHLYVLIPVLDREKHYFLAADEIDKLVAKGGEWLPTHPACDLIARRYLVRSRSLANLAIERLAALAEDQTTALAAATVATDDILGGVVAPEGTIANAAEASPDQRPTDEDGIALAGKDAAEGKLEQPLRLHDLRLDRVTDVLLQSGAKRVLDLGCGSGKLLKRLVKARQFTKIIGVDVGIRDLEIAARRLKLDTLSETQRERITLLQGALTYHDPRLAGFDAAALVEVIEHVDPERLPHVERALFEKARPGIVVVTTPNRDYNVKFEGLPAGKLRHADHRFEWTRAEFAVWADSVASRFGYGVRIEPLGEEDPELGAPSQMAVFERGAEVAGPAT